MRLNTEEEGKTGKDRKGDNSIHIFGTNGVL